MLTYHLRSCRCVVARSLGVIVCILGGFTSPSTTIPHHHHHSTPTRTHPNPTHTHTHTYTVLFPHTHAELEITVGCWMMSDPFWKVSDSNWYPSDIMRVKNITNLIWNFVLVKLSCLSLYLNWSDSNSEFTCISPHKFKLTEGCKSFF